MSIRILSTGALTGSQKVSPSVTTVVDVFTATDDTMNFYRATISNIHSSAVLAKVIYYDDSETASHTIICKDIPAEDTLTFETFHRIFESDKIQVQAETADKLCFSIELARSVASNPKAAS